MLKKVIILMILSAILFSSFSLPALAYELSEEKASVEGYYLYNFENNLIMAQKNVDKKISASSTVKIMTACIALESGIPFDHSITVTKEMLSEVSGRFMGLKEGDIMSFGDLLYSMICASFNDAAYVIVYAVGGSVAGFLELMNNKASDLGMNSTVYVDATGMSPSSVTTISDLIKLVKYMIGNEEYIRITSTKVYNLSSIATSEYNKITNRSGLISAYKGFSNFNTGSSAEDGDCAISYINNGEHSFISIVMNARSNTENDTNNYAEIYTKNLLSHGLYGYSEKIVIPQNKIIDSLPILYSINNETVNIYPENNLNAYISEEISIEDDISINYYLFNDELKAPLRSGDKVGVIIASNNGKYIGSTFLVVRESIERNFFLYLMDSIKSYLLSRAFALSLVFLVIMSVWYYFQKRELLNKMFRRKRQRKTRYVK